MTERRQIGVSPVIALLLAMPVLYVLGVGPARWAWECDYISDEVFDVFRPAITVAEFYGLTDWLYWYIRFWI